VKIKVQNEELKLREAERSMKSSIPVYTLSLLNLLIRNLESGIWRECKLKGRRREERREEPEPEYY
jgi:hypothetical protein